MTALFDSVIFGPIHSRRLGLSLGVNLLPQRAKICNFDCIYCECGSNSERLGAPSQRSFAQIDEVERQLRQQLLTMAEEGTPPDVITFAGNGEPTLHPQFERIISLTSTLRDELCPNAKISLLSNATTLEREGVARALASIDNVILKLDSAIDATARVINRPAPSYSVERVVEGMKSLGKGCIVQTMILRGEVDGRSFDNTQEVEVEAWIEAIRTIRPASVMLYSLDRDTPCEGLEQVSHEEMEQIAERVRAEGILCSVS